VRWSLLGMLWAASAGPASSAAVAQPWLKFEANTFRCTVTGVHDGDGPIYCAEGPKIRLQAIAARELDGSCSPGHPCPAASAHSARMALDRLTRGQVLRCERTGTSYGRVTAWCWRADGREINCEMVRSGTALPWRKHNPAGRLCRR
jgi:endonuclease YncB( thermonuclease family)